MSIHRLWVHLVWATRDRQPLLAPSVDGELASRLDAACAALGCQAVAVGNADDHVHVLIAYPARSSVASIAQRLKAACATPFTWHAGYYAESVSDVAAVAEMVRNQRADHDASKLPEPWEEAFER